MRTIACLVFLTACGGSVASSQDAGSDSSGATDGAAPSDSGSKTDAPTDPLGTFCQGGAAKLEENGKDNPVFSVKGKAIYLNCCNAAAVTIATGQHAALYTLRWQQYGGGPSPVVLGGMDTNVVLALGCDPTTTSCTSGNSVELYTQGFVGTITYQQMASSMRVSYCVAVSETPSDPHAIVHSLRLYVPNVDSP